MSLATEYRSNLQAFDKAETGERQAELCAKAEAISQKAFEEAIRIGRLSRNSSDTNFAGDFMFMGFNDTDKALFKNIITRDYLA